ncbi:sensor histidine kinase [Paenibacillus methanolicus]|uniref:Two-component system sensor histidine kinase YesM n=1 Tax=Paenibacillus methanolicus TaxID=582686 RepID=A0A5S5BY38_9BACL|nr:histidine kinase [Paenibacillus methanolicus]TYP70563.1 two-component system sensor histidine kinase YesM [Paenibacillus methanolicus]
MNTFTKIVGLILMLVIPIIGLYWFSYKTSLQVVSDEVEKSMYKDLGFFAAQTDNVALQLSKSGLVISEDINVRALEFIEIASLYEQTAEKLRIDDKLKLLIASSTWDTTLSIYAPDTKTFVSSNASLQYDPAVLDRGFSRVWNYTTDVHAYFRKQPRFVRYITEPFDAPLPQATLIVEMSFPATELVKSLDRFKAGGKGDPFFITSEGEVIASNSANRDLQRELTASLDLGQLSKKPFTRFAVTGSEYAVSCVWMRELGLYLVDYLPIQDVVRPITLNSYLFYGAIFFLLVGSTIGAYFLYTNVQVPIRELVRGVRKLKRGDYPTLNVFHPNNEFHFLLVSFNDMARQIEQLIQNVYLETIRSRDANLKQLQSQINPHFLYNCFTLIRSLARLGEKETVMELAMHLSKYYRYTTRSERMSAELREELDLVGSYLAIQAIKVQDLQYEIDIPETMRELELPRLILQPLVENAVLHGIEPAGCGMIRVAGARNDRYNVITVEDDGVGVTEEQLAQLQQQISMPPTEDKGCALWNTRQRMQLQFGAEAGLRIMRREQGGLTAELYWPNKAEESLAAS